MEKFTRQKLIHCFSWSDTDRTENDAYNNSCTATCISCRGNDLIETHRLLGGIYKYTVEMGSGAMIYIPSFIKTVTEIQSW
jgi:hypothetical protein